MAQGTLEINLVGAKGLEDTDFLNNMDPYVLLTYGTQKQKSSVASGQGSEPQWNESFTFNVTPNGCDEITLKILDSDYGNEDTCVGEATVPLEPVLNEGKVPTTPYNVVKDQEFRGEIKLSLTFRSEGMAAKEETYGGWTGSAANLEE